MMLPPFEIFKVLSVETRLKIIELLKSRGALGVKSIAEEFGITPAVVSQHLKILRHAGLVRNNRLKPTYSQNSKSMTCLDW